MELLKNKRLRNREEFRHLVSISKIVFENDLPLHFRIEESVIFPIMHKRLQEGNRIVLDMISEHKYIMKRFDEIKDIKDYDKMSEELTELMKTLSIHAKQEDELFSSIHFSEEEQSIADKKALSMGF